MSVDTHQSQFYKPLQTKSIRLLYLQPAKSLTAPLVGALEIVQLEDGPPQNEALSYAWDGAFNEHGSGVVISLAPREMLLEGSLIDITGNLSDALRRLRHQAQTKVLWIDALCIHQEDPLERSAQVATMTDIYSAANQVIVWLGEVSDDGDGELFFKLCRRHVHMLEIPWLHAWRKALVRFVRRIDRRFSKDNFGYWGKQSLLTPFFCPDAKKRYEILSRSSTRRYFSRRWCTQEVVVAKDLTIMCGIHQLPWHVFVRHNLNIVRPVQHTWQYIGGDALKNMRRIRTSYADDVLDAIDVLQRASELQCSDERDYFYSIAGLLQRDSQCPTINIDYSMTWHTAQVKFVSDFMQVGRLSARWILLSHAASQQQWDDPRRTPGQPSWVVDFRFYLPKLANTMANAAEESDYGRTIVRGEVLEVNLVYCGKVGSIPAGDRDTDPYEKALKPDDYLYTLPKHRFIALSRYRPCLAMRPVADKADTFRLTGTVLVFDRTKTLTEASEVHTIYFV